MAKPAIQPRPTRPIHLVDMLPHPIGITAEVALTYAEICDDWKLGIESEVLSEEAACNWAIKGYTIQGGLTIVQMWNEAGTYAQLLRNHIDTLEATIWDMYEIGMRQQKAVLND